MPQIYFLRYLYTSQHNLLNGYDIFGQEPKDSKRSVDVGRRFRTVQWRLVAGSPQLYPTLEYAVIKALY